MEHKRVKQIIRLLPKGQITLPQSIRERYHIEPNDIIELIPADDALILKLLKVTEDTLSKLREKEWRRYGHELIESLTRLERMPYNSLPRLCR